ncbi:MAG TPA: nuclear transport factor 2 family protein [Candidatus Acidoferrales bacterium]|nr:nuclear transport factor 2 family protein [Candidatus Acidoferrales bacterium]
MPDINSDPRQEHPNAGVVRQLYSAFAQGDLKTARDCFADDAVWHVPGRSPLAGDHRGWEEIGDYLRKLVELGRGTLRAELTDVLANDQYAVALQHTTARRGSKGLDVTACQVVRIRDGRILEMQGYYSDQYGIDDFFS